MTIQMKLFFVLIFVSLQSQAGGLFEPALIYQTSGKYDPQTTATYAFNTIGYGGRLGWNFQEIPVLIGVEYYATPSSTYKYSGSGASTFAGSESWYGAFFGFRFDGVRIIGSYIFSDDQNIKSSDALGVSNGEVKDKGNGYKVGMYYDIFSHVSLGIEYYSITYTSESNAGAGYSELNPNTKKSAIMGSLSFPFHFLGGGKARR